MTVWMIWASLVTLLVAAAAASVEWAVRFVGRPARHVWSLAAVASVGLMAGSTRAPSSEPGPTSAGGELQTAAADLLRELAAGAGPTSALLRRTDDLAVLAWAAASGLLVVALVAGLWRLSRRARSWTAAVVDGREVLVSESFGPALIGIFAPRIVVPRWALGLGAERLRMTCLHEAEHRRGGDGLLLLASALVVAAAPWNPGLWWIHARLRTAVEIDCDARVLRAGARPVPYGALLLELSVRALDVPRMVAAFARPRTHLERRMTMIVRSQAPRGAAEWSRAAGGVAVGALLVVVACRAPTPTDVGAADGDATSSTAIISATPAPHLEAERAHPNGVIRLREVEADERGAVVHLDRGAELTGEGAPEATLGHTIRLRGGAAGTGDPLIYVDGIRIAGSGVMDELSPDRIERIEILKGPAAVGLYGSEATAGVIQIFIKEASEPRK